MEGSLARLRITYDGHASTLNNRPLTQVVLQGLLAPSLSSINMVNAPVVAKARNVEVTTVEHEHVEGYQTLVTIEVSTDQAPPRRFAGTLVHGQEPRLVSVRDIEVEARLGRHMLYVRNLDQPGFIGSLGRILGDAGINIATFHLGRDRPGGEAVALVEVDQPLPDSVVETVCELPQVRRARALAF
jgi:D-3-phosphoglycerate dehydrogenase